ncbi:alpha/beta hydrolase [Flavobacterium sp.]|uniref:alpha/beta hydrolase n=1 Tax=Flavobacterium sp. TaxID=239 RepID=UPI00286D71FE|nr:alpha/beta hydrolase [Flavobacterium sp.]
MSKIHVYFMPGMAASSLIFERIKLPEDVFETHLLDWFMPEKSQTLEEYAKQMALNVKHDNAVLIGVSFGGILVQEMAPFLNLKKLIIISSVKNNSELPQRMKLAKTTKAYKLLPTGMAQNLEVLSKYAFGAVVKQRLKLYEKYMSMRDKIYLDWSIEQIINWSRTQTDENVIHIHGDADEVFPIKNIKNAIPLKEATHIMILNRYKWFNSNLPDIILK